MVAPHGQALRIRQSHLKLTGQFVHSHGLSPITFKVMPKVGEIAAKSSL
jgi:hypothetical protein